MSLSLVTPTQSLYSRMSGSSSAVRPRYKRFEKAVTEDCCAETANRLRCLVTRLYAVCPGDVQRCRRLSHLLPTILRHKHSNNTEQLRKQGLYFPTKTGSSLHLCWAQARITGPCESRNQSTGWGIGTVWFNKCMGIIWDPVRNISDVNKDWTCKDKDQAYKDKD